MLSFILNWSLLSLILASPDSETEPLSLKSGDLLFISLDCGPTCEAIEQVTLRQFGRTKPALSHLGIIEIDPTGRWIWEAMPPKGVQRITLESFLERPHNPEHLRTLSLTEEYQSYVPAVLDQLARWQGRPYDPIFWWDDSSFYCSELVYRVWEVVAPELELFKNALRPMEYGLPLSRESLVWQNYYQRYALSAPNGRPGVSPLGLYLSAKTKLLTR